MLQESLPAMLAGVNPVGRDVSLLSPEGLQLIPLSLRTAVSFSAVSHALLLGLA